ncbi:hypothetical protein UCDDS831_g02388 [Diplodia seriata]|uniref:DUF6536 domain-containing protein n=1 Tax=Diplodia seriata TaxID=420778 RepID=A0A0G2EQP9_9PEZI|nr:hypothetical protein UCDDS831_g02388 [Diplodia seriata]
MMFLRYKLEGKGQYLRFKRGEAGLTVSQNFEELAHAYLVIIEFRHGSDEGGGLELNERPPTAHSRSLSSRSLSDNFEAILERSKDADDDEQLLKKAPPSVHRQRTFRQQHLSGWRVGAIGATVSAAVVLVLNICVTLWVTFSPFPKNDGIGTLLEGSCAHVKSSSRWIHLVINVLSTVLLSCSNYCMQVLASPTRDELVKAHNRRFWLHIGVPNLRNLLYIGKDRRNLFLLLAVSSIPLHLLFNSVVFANIQANEYQVIPATPDFLDGATYKTAGLVPEHIWTRNSTGDQVPVDVGNYTRSLVANATELRDKIQRREIKYENMTAEWCVKNYAQQFLSSYGNVLVIQDEIDFKGFEGRNTAFGSFSCVLDGIQQKQGDSATSCLTSIPFHSAPDVFPAWDWQCPPPWQDNCTQVDYDVLESQPNWAPYGSPARYCLAEVVDEHCRLQFSFAIAGAVIACNIIKTLCMGYIVWKYRQTFLATIGDAIASFLDEPDPETKDRCLYSRPVFEKEWEWMRHNELRDPKAVAVEPERYSSRRPFWGRAVSKTRWFATYFMYAVALIIGAVSIKKTLTGMPTEIGALWRTGFGDLLGNNLISGSVGNSVLGSVLLANLPQALLSYLYLLFNALYTCMLLTREYTQYLHHRKPLRVTSPTGRQRSTYWLHLPYRYSIPLLVASGLLHWLASQSLFLVQVTVLAEGDRDPSAARQISTCGYSPVAIIMTVVVGSVIVLGGLGLALRRYPAGMPLAMDVDNSTNVGQKIWINGKLFSQRSDTPVELNMAPTISDPGTVVTRPAYLAHVVLQTQPSNHQAMISFYKTFPNAAVSHSNDFICFLTMYYVGDPDGNEIETQVDNLGSADEADAYMGSDAFRANPIGAEFDPEELVRRLEAWEDEREIKKRAEVGPRSVEAIRPL